MKNFADTLHQHLIQAKDIAIFSHIHADGDTLGAQLGLASVLVKMGKQVSLYNTMSISPQFSFLPDMAKIQVFSMAEQKQLPDTVIFVDCGSLERAGFSEDMERQFLRGRTIFNIDHHEGNTLFGTHNLVIGDSPATCDMIIQLLDLWQVSPEPDAATALYLGLSTDTGSFKFDRITPEMFERVAGLIRHGADFNTIRLQMYETVSQAKFALQRHLYQNVSFANDQQIAWAVLEKDFLNHIHAEDSDVDGLTNIMKEISGVELGILFRELSPNRIKVSFRTKNWLDANVLAMIFSGGGHRRAAGCTLLTSREEAVRLVLDAAIQCFHGKEC